MPTPSYTLTGIQASGHTHLGNIVGAMNPITHLSVIPNSDIERFIFIADLHALTKHPDASTLIKNTQHVAAAWGAFLLGRLIHSAAGKEHKVYFYRQSRIPEICELYWYLSCLTSKSTLEKAHAYKATGKDEHIKAGVFNYPVLMAADILLFSVSNTKQGVLNDMHVPVGKDQAQHLEIARDLATRFNHRYGNGKEILRVPTPVINPTLLPGTDGEKMSKSRNNTLDVLGDEEALRKAVFSIKTDSEPIPKNPTEADCAKFQQSTLYKVYAAADKVIATSGKKDLLAEYRQGGYGYGHAKADLYVLLRDGFKGVRGTYQGWVNKPKEIAGILKNGRSKREGDGPHIPIIYGEDKVRAIAQANMEVIRKAIGIWGD